MTRTSKMSLVTLAMTALIAVAWAQSPEQPPEDSENFTFRTDTRLVDLHATVVDKEGHLIPNLPQSAFAIYENGVKQNIKVFRHEDAPVSLGLIIDNSASMQDKRAKVGSAALALVGASNPDDEVFIMNFNEETSLEKDYTSNIEVLADAFKTINSRGGTAMRDALRMGIEHLKRGGRKEKKILLVVTDGEDNSSLNTLDHVIHVAQRSDVIIYGIGLLGENDTREAARAKRALDALALATGGQVWYATDISEVDSIARQVAHEIRNQYIIGYTPSSQALDGTFRRIRVVVNRPGDPIVRTRPGYYAGQGS